MYMEDRLFNNYSVRKTLSATAEKITACVYLKSVNKYIKECQANQIHEKL